MKKIDAEELLGLLALDTRAKVARSLLAGNDTGCFTTEQYKAAYEQQAWTIPNKLPWVMEDGSCLAVSHLRSIPQVVREVSPGVWLSASERTPVPGPPNPPKPSKPREVG